jgi:hypothetical protein
VGELEIVDGNVQIVVFFVENGRRKKKVVSPILLAALQTLWLNNDIVSDDEDDDGLQDARKDPLWPILPLTKPLTLFDVELSYMPFVTHSSVKWIIAQVRLIQRVTL